MKGESAARGADSPSSPFCSPLTTDPSCSGRRIYRGLKNVKLERILVLGFHVLILAVVALLASGLAGPIPNMPLVNAGIVLLVLAWLALSVWTGVAFLPGQHDRQSLSHPEGTVVSYFPLLNQRLPCLLLTSGYSRSS